MFPYRQKCKEAGPFRGGRSCADTRDAEQVYVLNVSYKKNKDGGKIFVRRNAPYGDQHDLWIAPEDPGKQDF